jgi:hypothetical protein
MQLVGATSYSQLLFSYPHSLPTRYSRSTLLLLSAPDPTQGERVKWPSTNEVKPRGCSEEIGEGGEKICRESRGFNEGVLRRERQRSAPNICSVSVGTLTLDIAVVPHN